MIKNFNGSEGELLWELNPERREQTTIERFTRFAIDRGARCSNDYADVWRWSVENPADFWANWAEFVGVDMVGATDQPVVTNDDMPHAHWFPGKKLNYAAGLLGQHSGTAIIELDELGGRRELSFDEVRSQVAALAAHLRDAGVEVGDRVVAILPNVAEAVIALLATASIGAIWSVCAPEFGSGAIASRFQQLDPKVIIATPAYTQGGKERDKAAEIAAVISQLPTLKEVIWVEPKGKTDAPMVDVPAAVWAQIMTRREELKFTEVDFSHPLWVLFSSGTTGIPKGIVHSQGGALLEELKLAAIHNDVQAGDHVLIVASTSWVVWNGLVACLGLGASIVLVDGSPTYPTIDRIWNIVCDERVAVLGLSAAYIHACMKADLVPKNLNDLSSLRVISATGSPLSADGFRWVYRNVGDVWLTSQSGGTDIASVFVGGVPTLPVRAGYIQAPALGVSVESWDDSGHRTSGRGELVVTKPLPSMPLFFWGDADGSRYQTSYFDTFPGIWRHGDFIEFSDFGVLIHGRSDSTLNRNGLRLGTADIYSVVESIPEVAESLIIGIERGTDYYMPLFVKTTSGADEGAVRVAIDRAIREGLSARYLPDEIIFVSGIPHTRTGKKLEVPVKRLFQGAALSDVADLGAVDDPMLLAEYAQLAQTTRES